MEKAAIYCDKSPLKAEAVKMLYTEKVDERIIQFSNTLPDKFSDYVDKKLWLNPIGRTTLFLPERLFKPTNKVTLRKAFKTFMSYPRKLVEIQVEVINLMKKDHDDIKHGIRPLTYFSVIAEISKRKILSFIITDLNSPEDFEQQVAAIERWLESRSVNLKAHRSEIRRSHKPDKKTTFLQWNGLETKWEIANLLFLAGNEKMLRYRDRDPRFAKPDMIIHDANLNRELTLPMNWTIHGRSRGYTMDRPNDIAMYQSVANKALARAKAKYDEIHSKRITELILDSEVVVEFFDYFEEIIQAVVMSYTTIECIANSCIPVFEKYVEKKDGSETIHSKDSIERNFSLKEKLKTIIPSMLGTKSPVDENWWSTFTDLEKLRHEIIHTKNSKAETRYSQLIHDRIFVTANVHNRVAAYFGSVMSAVKRYPINEFPVGIGCDAVIPSLASDKEFNKMYRSLFNPSVR